MQLLEDTYNTYTELDIIIKLTFLYLIQFSLYHTNIFTITDLKKIAIYTSHHSSYTL